VKLCILDERRGAWLIKDGTKPFDWVGGGLEVAENSMMALDREIREEMKCVWSTKENAAFIGHSVGGNWKSSMYITEASTFPSDLLSSLPHKYINVLNPNYDLCQDHVARLMKSVIDHCGSWENAAWLAKSATLKNLKHIPEIQITDPDVIKEAKAVIIQAIRSLEPKASTATTPVVTPPPKEESEKAVRREGEKEQLSTEKQEPAPIKVESPVDVKEEEEWKEGQRRVTVPGTHAGRQRQDLPPSRPAYTGASYTHDIMALVADSDEEYFYFAAQYCIGMEQQDKQWPLASGLYGHYRREMEKAGIKKFPLAGNKQGMQWKLGWMVSIPGPYGADRVRPYTGFEFSD